MAKDDLVVVLKIKNGALYIWRNGLGLNQSQAAKMLGVDPSFYGLIESLKWNPTKAKACGKFWKDRAVSISLIIGKKPEEIWPDSVLKCKAGIGAIVFDSDLLQRRLNSYDASCNLLGENNAEGNRIEARLEIGRIINTYINRKEKTHTAWTSAEAKKKRVSILVGYFVEEKTLRELGVEYNLTAERIRGIIHKVLRHLRGVDVKQHSDEHAGTDRIAKCRG